MRGKKMEKIKKMDSKDLLAVLAIAVSGFLFLLLNVIYVFQSSRWNVWMNIGTLLEVILIVGALTFAILEKKYLAGLVVASLKITLPLGNDFLMPFFRFGIFDLDGLTETFDFIFALLSVAVIAAILIQTNKSKLVINKLDLKMLLNPLIVLTFLMLYSTYENAVVASLSEILALALAAYITAKLLFVSVFINVPFMFIQRLANGGNVNLAVITHFLLGLLLLVYGCYLLFKAFKPKLESHKAAKAKPQPEPKAEPPVVEEVKVEESEPEKEGSVD